MTKLSSVFRMLYRAVAASTAVACAAVLALAVLAPAAQAQSASGFTYNGLNLTSYQGTEYNNTTATASSIRATGANYTAVLVTQYQQTATSNTIAPETTSSPGYNGYSLSPTDAAVTTAIKNLQAQGLVVSMKPQVDSIDGTFRGSFAPSNPAAWFASYQTFILHYAQLAAQNNVGVLVIGTELKSLTTATYKSNWETIISALRTQYPGLTLIYGANATGSGDEFTSVSFWADVDVIGVDGYFPLTNQTDPSISQLVAAWTNNRSGFNIVQALKNLQSMYNKPLIFSEVGYVSVAGTNEQPYASISGAYDALEQQDCYEAFFQVFSAQTAWMKGVFWWDWTVSPPAANDTGYSSQNKGAGTTTLPKYFGNTAPGFTLAPAQSTVALGQGLSTADVVAVTAQGGFTGAVTMTVAGLPAGVTGTFSAGTVAGTQNLNLTASSTAAIAGPVTVTVTGTSGGQTATTALTFSVVAPVTPAITLTNPGAQTAGATVALSATSNSYLAITYASSTPTVCTVNSAAATATTLAAGTCTISASQPAGATYTASTTSQSFLVNAIPAITVPVKDNVLISQVNYRANVGGYALSGGNPAGGSLGVNSFGTAIIANNQIVEAVNVNTGVITSFATMPKSDTSSNSAAVAIDGKNNAYIGNTYGPVNSIVFLPYVGGAANAGYAIFSTPTTSTPICVAGGKTECLLPANLGAVNASTMAFDAAGNLFYANGGTAGPTGVSGNSIFECNVACIGGTGAPVVIYTEPTVTPAPSATSGQPQVGSIALDSAGNLFFTDSTIYVDPGYNYFSFSSRVNELPVSTSAGYGGVVTGFSATPMALYTLNTPNPTAYGNQVGGVVVQRSGTGDTVYFADENDGIFGFPDSPGGISVANGKPTALFTAANQGAKNMTIDAAGNLYPVGYSAATGSGGDTLAQVTLDAVQVPSSATGTASSPSATTSPVTTYLNDTTCTGPPPPAVTFAGTANSSASATATASTACTSTLTGAASFATTVSLTPITAGPDTVTLTATDQSTNTGSFSVTGTGAGFTLTPSTAAVTLPQSNSAMDTITIADFAGFTGNVSLAATGLPTGVTASFGMNPATASSVLTLTASSTAALGGPVNVTVTGTSSANTASTILALTVTPPQGFTLSASPTAVSVPQGNSGTSTITVVPVSGFPGSVTLAASGLPAGVTAAFSTNPATSTSVLTLTASTTATVGGPVNVTVTGTSGTLTASTTVAVTVSSTPSFTLTPSASTVTVTQGSTGTDTFTVNATNGFASGVTFAASGLPAGITAAFSPNPTTNGSSALTLTATGTATVGGPVTVTITGTSGTMSQTASFALTVNAQPGFTLAATPAAVSVAQSGTATSTITVTDQGGFTGSVTLVATGLPAGVTAAFGTNPTTGTSVVTFTAGSAAVAGTSMVTITGTSGTVTGTTTIPLTVTPPASFTLTPSAATLSIMQGTTGIDTVTVTGANGFNGSVMLAASGLPTGVTVTFATNPTTGSSVATFNVNGTVATGTSTVTITGTSGTLTASTMVALTVTTGPTFTLSPAPAALTIVQGATALDTITVKPANGFAGNVTLAVSGLPSGVTGVFATSPTMTSSTLTLTASATAAAGGPVMVTITGTSGTQTATTTVALTVNVPPSFTLAATPATITVAQTTTAAVTVNVNSLGGFSATPVLTATGQPDGVTASFTAGTTAGTQVLTLTAAVTTVLPSINPATVTITGKSGTLTASTTIAVTVIPPPSFTITGPDLIVKAGAQVLNTDPLTIVATNGFSGTVSLTCAITPLATANPATCSLAPASVTLSGTTAQMSVLTVTTTGGSLVDNRHTPFLWATGGGTVLACMLFLGLPGRRRRNWISLLVLLIALTALGGSIGCASTNNISSQSNGTSVGGYKVTINGVSGTTTSSGSISLTVQ